MDETRETVATTLSSRDAERVRRVADRGRTTPSNVVRSALLSTGVLVDDPRRKSRPVDLDTLVASLCDEDDPC